MGAAVPRPTTTDFHGRGDGGRPSHLNTSGGGAVCYRPLETPSAPQRSSETLRLACKADWVSETARGFTRLCRRTAIPPSLRSCGSRGRWECSCGLWDSGNNPRICSLKVLPPCGVPVGGEKLSATLRDHFAPTATPRFRCEPEWRSPPGPTRRTCQNVLRDYSNWPTAFSESPLLPYYMFGLLRSLVALSVRISKTLFDYFVNHRTDQEIRSDTGGTRPPVYPNEI